MTGAFETARAAYEGSVVRLLVGRSISAVAYYEIQYEGGFVGWRSTPNVGHLLDQGLDLTMVDGHSCLVTWGQTFNQYDLLVRAGTLRDELTAGCSYDVSRERPWNSLLGRRILDVAVYWSWVEEEVGDSRKRIHYPLDLAVSFGDSTVFLCARRYFWERDEFFPAGDEIAVIFDDAAARRYRIGPFQDDKSLPD
jgi:hypothetical protein